MIALANLGTGLAQTIACGNRILDILEEKPQVEEVENGVKSKMDKIALEKVSFSYQQEEILKNLSLAVEPEQITGIMGCSGSGKSTILKLMMRFWDVDKGTLVSVWMIGSKRPSYTKIIWKVL